MNLTPTGSIHLFHYMATFEVEAGTFTMSLGHTSTTKLEAPKYKQAVKTIKDKLVRTKSKLGFPIKH